MFVCVCVTEVGSWGSGTTAVTHKCHTTSYGMCVITSGHIQGATAEEDAVEEQQLKWRQLGSSKLYIDVIREQQLNRMQSGSSS